jgi:hypothetical protein
MPWTADDATSHTSKATTPALRQLWADTANGVLRSTGDDVTAIRKANATIAKRVGATRHSDKHAREAAETKRRARGFQATRWLR